MIQDVDVAPLDELITQLDLLEHKTPDALAELLSRPFLWVGVAQHTRFDHRRYVRVPLARGPDWEVRLLCWLLGQSSSMHDHGASACALRVLSGEGQEDRLVDGARTLKTGSIVRSYPGEVHQVRCPATSRTPMVSVHIYSPPLPVEQPSLPGRPPVIILGGGLSGIATALQLLKDPSEAIRVTLVERDHALGRGLAYQTTDPRLLLNVPAGRMSVDPALPDDFVTWAQGRDPAVTPASLLPRLWYGDYLQDRLADMVRRRPGRLRVVRGTATEVQRSTEGWTVRLEDGTRFSGAAVVLATGHLQPRVPRALGRRPAYDPRFILEPWKTGVLRAIPAGARVLVLGTGLSAMDVLLTLRRQGHRGRVMAMSRRGLIPGPQLADVDQATHPEVVIDPSTAPRTAKGLHDWVVGLVDHHAARGIPWQRVIDAVRPLTTPLFQGLLPRERERFLREIRPIWEVVRHRAPAEQHAELAAWASVGGFEIEAGCVLSTTARRSQLAVAWERNGGEVAVGVFDHIVVCIGSDWDIQRSTDPLWRSVRRGRLIVPDADRIGVACDADGRALDAAGCPTGLWVIGGFCRSQRWESSTAADLARRAVDLSAALQAALRDGEVIDGSETDALAWPRDTSVRATPAIG